MPSAQERRSKRTCNFSTAETAPQSESLLQRFLVRPWVYTRNRPTPLVVTIGLTCSHRYCSTTCQAQHWSSHKRSCGIEFDENHCVIQKSEFPPPNALLRPT